MPENSAIKKGCCFLFLFFYEPHPWLSLGRYRMKLLPSPRVLCTPCNLTHHVTSLHAKPHTWDACVFSCNLPPTFLARWPGSFTCYCGMGGTVSTDTGIRVSPEGKLQALVYDIPPSNSKHWFTTSFLQTPSLSLIHISEPTRQS